MLNEDSRTTDSVLAQTAAYWEQFYARHALRHEPSPFATWCMTHQFDENCRLLELGCGNGRDSFAFRGRNLPTLSVDGCHVAIAGNREYQQVREQQGCAMAEGEFHAIDFSRLEQLGHIASDALQKVNTVYTRFVLHAIPEVLEDKLLDFCASILPAGGKMLHEFRTLHDPLMMQGDALSGNERVTDHYRRFIDAQSLRRKLSERGWREIFFIESTGLAPFGKEDPVVARIVLEKTATTGCRT